LAHITVVGALRGERKHFLEILKRIWPVVTKVEVSVARGQPFVPRLETADFSMVSEEGPATIRRIAPECLMRRPDDDALRWDGMRLLMGMLVCATGWRLHPESRDVFIY
jgi:hypothetical protein